MSSAWIVAGLGDGMLWQDEAQTALIARSILDDPHHLPRGADTLNSFSQEGGVEYDADTLWRWHTWLPFYLVAGSFAMFGETTFAARLPFALFGAMTVLLVVPTARLLWRDPRAAYSTAWMLLCCVPFLILARQCRYYSLTMFFGTWMLLAYLRLVDPRVARRFRRPGWLNRLRRGSWMELTAAGTLMFHTQYLYTAIFLAGLILHAALFHRTRLKQMMITIVATAILASPWFVLVGTLRFNERYGGRFNVLPFHQFVLEYLAMFRQWVFPDVLLLMAVVLVALAFVQQRRTRRSGMPARSIVLSTRQLSGCALLVILTMMTLLCLSAVSPTPFFRYLAPLLPLSALACALIVRIALAVHRLAALALLAWMPFGWGTINYIREVTTPFRGPVEALVAYLDQHAQRDDVFVITYEDMPMKFYTTLRVIGPLSGEHDDKADLKSANWVVLKEPLLPGEKALAERIDQQLSLKSDFEVITLDAAAVRFQNREDPAEHRFVSADENIPRLKLYHRKASTMIP